MSDVSLHIQSEPKKKNRKLWFSKKQHYYSLVLDEKDYDFMRRLFTAAEVSLYLSHAYCLLF